MFLLLLLSFIPYNTHCALPFFFWMSIIMSFMEDVVLMGMDHSVFGMLSKSNSLRCLCLFIFFFLVLKVILMLLLVWLMADSNTMMMTSNKMISSGCKTDEMAFFCAQSNGRHW